MFLNFLLDFIRVSLILPLFKPGKLNKYLLILKYRKGFCLCSTQKFNSTPCDRLLASTTALYAYRQALQTPLNPVAEPIKQAKISVVKKTVGQNVTGWLSISGFIKTP